MDLQNLPLSNDLTKEYNADNFWGVLKIASACSLPTSIMAQIISVREQRMQSKLINELVQRIEKLELDVGALCKKNINEDEAKDLIYFSLVKASRCHKEEQITKMSYVIAEALQHRGLDYSDAEMLVDIVADLNVNESMTFQNIITLFKNSNMKVIMENGKEWSFTETELREQKCCNNLLDGMLERLVGKGVLVKRTAHVKMTWGGDVAESNDEYSFSHYGKLLVELVY